MHQLKFSGVKIIPGYKSGPCLKNDCIFEIIIGYRMLLCVSYKPL